jgi:hypothetical protein
MTGWLAARYGFARGTAREWVRVARALRTLPEISRAHASGRLSWDQLKPLTRFATPQTDEYWSKRGPELRPSTLYLEAARHEKVRKQEAEQIQRMRYLTMWWDPERPCTWKGCSLPSRERLSSRRWSAGRNGSFSPTTPTLLRMHGWPMHWWSWLRNRKKAPPPSPPWWSTRRRRSSRAGNQPKARGWRRPRPDSGYVRMSCADWPATPGSSGCSIPATGRWGSGGEDGRYPGRSVGSFGSGTEDAGSPAASEGVGHKPTTSCTGVTAEGPISITSFFSATPTTG